MSRTVGLSSAPPNRASSWAEPSGRHSAGSASTSGVSCGSAAVTVPLSVLASSPSTMLPLMALSPMSSRTGSRVTARLVASKPAWAKPGPVSSSHSSLASSVPLARGALRVPPRSRLTDTVPRTRSAISPSISRPAARSRRSASGRLPTSSATRPRSVDAARLSCTRRPSAFSAQDRCLRDALVERQLPRLALQFELQLTGQTERPRSLRWKSRSRVETLPRAVVTSCPVHSSATSPPATAAIRTGRSGARLASVPRFRSVNCASDP